MPIIKLRTSNAYRKNIVDGVKPDLTSSAILSRSFLHDHTELQLSQRYGSVSISATRSDGSNCVRSKYIGYTDRVKWDTVLINITDEEEDLIWDAFKSVEGAPYDLVGLMSFLTKQEIIHPSKVGYWCTEICIWLLKQVPRFSTLPLIPDKTHPTMGDTVCRWYFETLTDEQRYLLPLDVIAKETAEWLTLP